MILAVYLITQYDGEIFKIARKFYRVALDVNFAKLLHCMQLIRWHNYEFIESLKERWINNACIDLKC